MSKNEAPKKPTGRRARNEARAWEADMDLRTYRPEQFLDPAALLSSFTEKAQELLEQLPDEDRPRGAQVTSALRQAVLEAFRTREQYVARLVETDAASWATRMPAKNMRRAIRASLIDSGIRVVESSDEGEYFVVVEGEGNGFEVVRPAYVDQATGKLILSGQLRRVFVSGKRDDSRTGTQDATATEEKP
ncbi:hypothetical protein ACWG5P_07420 [Streptomyces prasinus]